MAQSCIHMVIRPALLQLHRDTPRNSSVLTPLWRAGVGGRAAGGDLVHQAIRSAGGERFDAFAKATTPGRALYLWEDAVAPFYATGTPEPSRLGFGMGRLSCRATCVGLPASKPINATRNHQAATWSMACQEQTDIAVIKCAPHSR